MSNATLHRICKNIPSGAPVVLLVLGTPCETGMLPLEQQLREKCEQFSQPLHFYTVCVPEDEMPFPRIITPCVYYFVDVTSPDATFFRTNPLYTFDQDMEILFRMKHEQLSYDEAFYGDLLPTVRAMETMFDGENIHQYPPLVQQARSLARVMWESGKRAVKKLPVIASIDVANERLTICGGCDKNDNGRCSACGCHINSKTQLIASSCPLGKW
jgi:hypothetical protein